MENTPSKMQWFIDMYNTGKMDYRLARTHTGFGTVVMPTGYGKSSVIYEDIVNTIDNYDGKQKLIFNISCPILKLTQQFINDLFSILKGIYGERQDLAFYINSSDDGNNYSDAAYDLNIDVDKFSNIDKFMKSKTANIAIVASCHRSMFKFISGIGNVKGARLVNYLDEAHLIDIYKGTDDQAVCYIDITKLCRHSEKVYAFTATPNPDVTMAINAFNGFGQHASGKYILHVRPVEAIQQNIILPPHVSFISGGDDITGITPSSLNVIMKNSIRMNPDIKHKVLVTLKSSTELLAMRKELEAIGYKVFSTCSAYGFGTDEDMDDNTEITSFIKDVEEYDDHCFVLHIRQLIQGIDIKALTDCVLFDNSHGSMSNYRHMIQTIGRVLRPLAGERGICKEQRVKKVGQVYFITPNGADEIRRNIEQFIFRYYGFDNVTFESYEHEQLGMNDDDLFESFKPYQHFSSWDNEDIVDLLCNIEKYIEKQIAPTLKFVLNNGGKVSIQDEASKILNQFDAFGREYHTDDLLDNKDLLDKVLEMFNKYTIQPLF